MTINRNSTRRPFRFLLGAAACGALLASCGGNNTPTPTPTPTPSDSGTPTPSPTATPISFDFLTDFAIGTARTYIFAYFTPTGGVETFNDATRVNASGGISFTADPEVVLFGFSDLSDPVEFDAADLAGTTANSRTYVDGDEQLVLERPFTNVLTASYQTINSDIVGVDPGMLRSQRVVLVVIPVETTDDVTSAIEYTGTPVVVGGTSGTTMESDVTAPALTLTVTPGDPLDRLTGTLRIFEDSGSGPVEVAAMPFDSGVSALGAFGQTAVESDTNVPFADPASGFSGAYAGVLAGPNREEATLIYSISHDDGRKYVGHIILQDTTPAP